MTMERLATEVKVKEKYFEMLENNVTPSVRKLARAIGGGSHTTLAPILKNLKEGRFTALLSATKVLSPECLAALVEEYERKRQEWGELAAKELEETKAELDDTLQLVFELEKQAKDLELAKYESGLSKDKEIDELNRMLSDVLKQKDVLEGKLLELARDATTAKADLRTVQKEYIDCQSILERAGRDVSEFKANWNDAMQSNSRLMKDLLDACERSGSCLEQIRTLSNQLTEKDKKLEDADKEARRWKERVENLERTLRDRDGRRKPGRVEGGGTTRGGKNGDAEASGSAREP